MPMTQDMLASTTELPAVTGLASLSNNTTQNKISMLQESVQDKVARLAGKGVTTIEDKGTQASYAEHPERVNTMSPLQLQEELGAAATYQILTRPDGSKYQFRRNTDGSYARDANDQWIEDTVNDKTPIRNAYIDTTNEGNYKFGLARSDVDPTVMSPWTGKPITPFEARYMNQIGKHPYKGSGNEYNGTPGPRGVTPENGALMDISLPKALADKLEYDIHTNAGQLASRAMGQGPKTDTTTAQFGAGQSEYTTPDAPLWNSQYDMSKAKIAGNTVLPKEVTVVGQQQTGNQGINTTPKYTAEDLRKARELTSTNRSWGEAASDTGKQVVVGSLNAVKNLADIYGVATGDHDNWVSQTMGDAAKWYGESYSPALKAAAEHKGSEVAKGKDELEKFWIATKENFKNPMLISQLVVESAPMMAVALAGGEAMAAAKLGIGATEGMLAAGAVQQGADMGDGVYQSFFDPMKVTQKDWDNNAKYQEYVKQGMNPQDAKEKIASDTSRVVALASGLLSYGVNKFMPGGHSIESKLTGGKVGGLVKSTAGESATEVAEEGGGQIFQNLGQQQVTPGLDTFANVGQVSADAMAAGGATNVAIQGPGTLTGRNSKLTPEQESILAEPDEAVEVKGAGVNTAMSKKAKDAFWSKVQEAKNGYTNESSYRNRDDIRNIATDLLNGKDSTGILASDDSVHEKLDKIKELLAFVAEDSGLSDEHKNEITARLSEQLGVSPTYVANVVKEADETGKAIKQLKTGSDVENEVTSGPRGFLTYYNNAVSSMQNGDHEAADKYTRKLEEFLSSQEVKQARLLAAEKEVMREYNDRVKMEMQTSGLDQVEAGKKVYKDWAKDRAVNRGYAEVQYSDNADAKPFKLYKSQVVEHATAIANNKEYELGGYKTVYDINRSIEAMKSLLGRLEGDLSVSQGVPEVTKQWVDNKINSGVSKDELTNAVSSNSKLTSKQKQAVIDYVNKEENVPHEEPIEPTTNTDEPIPYEEPNNEPIHEEPTHVYEDPNSNEVPIEEPSYEEPIDVPHMEEPAHEDAVLLGERPAVKELPVGNEVRIVNEKNNVKDKLTKDIAKAKLDGDIAKVKELNDKLSKLQKWEDIKIAHSPVTKILSEVRKLYFGVTSSRVNNTVKVGKLTPLNVESINLDSKIKDTITSSIAAPMLTKDGKINKIDSEGDPARALLFNNDGSINGNVATAIWKAMNDYVSTSAGGLARPVTMEKLEDMFPEVMAKLDMNNPDDVMWAYDLMDSMANGGELLKLEAEGIGSDIMKLLGLKAADGKVSERDIQGIKASLGMMAIHMAESSGVLKITKVNVGGEGTVPVLQVGKNIKAGMLDATDEAKKYSSYDVPDMPKKSYSFEPIVRNEVEVHNQPYTDVTGLQKEMKQTLDSLAFKPNKGIEVLKEMYSNPEELKDVLGRISDEELANMSYDGRKAAESVNREIETKVDGFYRMMEDAKTDDGYRDMYFEWFVTKGGRTNSYATVVDPQSDKQLARWLVTTAGSRVDITRDDIVNNTKIGVGFKYGLVQAFDGALPEKVEVDKNSKAKVLAMADKLLAMTDDELKGMVKNSDHIGHAMLALANIREARKGAFTSDMVMEMDGLTNGLGFRLVQFPMNETMELLPKVGVVMEGDPMWEANTIADVKDKDNKYGVFKDLYETVAEKLKGSVVKLSKENTVLKKVLDNVLPNLADDKEARSMAKSPVMVTGYSAGETSTKLAIVNEQIGKLVEAIVAGKLNKEQLTELTKGTNQTADNIVEMLKNNSIKDNKMKALRGKLTGFYMEAYAKPMYSALTETIGKIKEVGDTITTAYDYMYKVLVNGYEAELAKKGGSQVLGYDEKVALMRKLLTEMGPIVRNSETTGELDRVLALSRKLVNISEEAKKAGIDKYSTSINSRGANSTDTVQMIMRTFGEPGAAGGVLQTHTEDNHTMARTMRDAKVKFNQIFDAMVLGINQWDQVKGYNKSFYELNKEFSMMNAVIEAVERNESNKYASKVTVKIGKEVLTGKDLLDRLNMYKVEIDANRAKIFSSKIKVGQMVGTDGTMYEVSPKEESARIDEMKANIKSMLQKFTKDSDGTINKGLSEIVKNMGCK